MALSAVGLSADFKKMIKQKTAIIFLILLCIGITSNSYVALGSSDIIIRPLLNPIANYIDTYNFHKVDGNYYRGGQPDEDDYQSFALLGIKTVINLRNADTEDITKEKKFAGRYGIKYVSIPMKASQPPTDEQIAYFFKLLDNPKNLPVYVHCWQGKDRTGIMTALYRVRDYGWNFDQAYSEMKQRGYHSFIYPKHREFLYSFIKGFFSPKISKI
jgi:protein tyrosine phosphatase (PTP) superfamily phosphohydrolase (DUF442 family)